MRALLALPLLVVPAAAAALERAVIDVEAGPLHVARNEQEYGPGGTRYDAAEIGQQDTLVVATRASLELGLGARHTLILSYLPLSIETTFRPRGDLVFDGTTFPSGEPAIHGYRFDGYRASYLFRFVDGEGPWILEAGASAQIRSAEVSLTSVDGTRYAQEPDIGFVPAVKLRASFVPGPLYVTLDFDGLSTFGAGDTDGSLYDGALWLGVPVGEGVDLVFRCRLYGGGADVPARAIYNFATFVSATAGLRVDLADLGGEDAGGTTLR